MSAVKFIKHIGLGHSLMPMTGTIYRDDYGKKVRKGVKPPADFLNKAKERRHEPVPEQTPHYALVSGVKNDEGRQLICIDTDCKTATETVSKMVELELKDYHFVWHSHYDVITDPEDQTRAKFLFWATEEMLELFPGTISKIQHMHTEILTHHTVYCPCPNNKAAKPWEWDGVSEMADVPKSLFIWLKREYEKSRATKETRDVEEIFATEQRRGYNREEYQHFASTGEIQTNIRNIWFDAPVYRLNKKEKGPRPTCVSQVDNDMGNEFLKLVCGVLTWDPSVDPELAIQVVKKIDDTWAEHGGRKDDLETAIIEPFIQKRIDDGSWVYNPDWQNAKEIGLKIIDKEGHEWEIFSDPLLYEYVAVCLSKREYEYFNRQPETLKNFVTILGPTIGKDDFAKIRNMNFTTDFTVRFGETPEGKFNLFKQNATLDCFHYPKKYEHDGKPRRKPIEFLALLHNAIMHEPDEEKFLRHVTTYFRTGWNSILNFFFTGSQGSGKSTIGLVLRQLMGVQHCLAILNVDHFTESYTEKFRNMHIVQLEEISDQLNRKSGTLDKTFMGRLKTYTTERPWPLRRMHASKLKPYDGRMLFLLNCNLEDDDARLEFPPTERRATVFESGENFLFSEAFAKWKEEYEGELVEGKEASEFFKRIHSEEGLLDIAYYLTTTYENVDEDTWQHRWPTKASLKMTKGGGNYEDKVSVWLDRGEFVEFYADALQKEVDDIFVQTNGRDEIYMPLCAMEKLFKDRGRPMNKAELTKKFAPLFGVKDESYVTLKRSPFNSHKEMAKEKHWGPGKACHWTALTMQRYKLNIPLWELKERAQWLLKRNLATESYSPEQDPYKDDETVIASVVKQDDNNAE